MRSEYDAVVVGSGPNGLAAAVTLARAGLSVCVFEEKDTPGGGARTAEVTLPGFRHDLCSAVHPMAYASGFFRSFGLDKRIPFITPEASYGHPLDGGRAGIAYTDITRTGELLGTDGPAWLALMGPLARHADHVARIAGSSLLRIPRHPVTLSRFGLRALEQGLPVWNLRFSEDIAPALLTGVMAHAIRPLPSLGAAASGLSLGAYAHGRGWPVPIGGSQSIIDCLADDLIAHGGEIITGQYITILDELPPARAVLLDTTPSALLSIAGSRVPSAYARTLSQFRYGNAVAKVDFALSGPVPWTTEPLRHTPTVHVGGSREQIRQAENLVASGRHSPTPYVLLSQPSIVDQTRAPAGGHVLWTYTHVPRNSTLDQTETITRQIERFAPGFRDLILANSSRTAAEMENYNPNYIGGDIAAGSPSFSQLVRRPTLSPDPWKTPVRGVYLCSSSTPPGPGVHGLAGFYAARSALRHEFGLSAPYLGLEPVGSGQRAFS